MFQRQLCPEPLEIIKIMSPVVSEAIPRGPLPDQPIESQNLSSRKAPGPLRARSGPWSMKLNSQRTTFRPPHWNSNSGFQNRELLMNKSFQTGFFTELMETMVSHCEMNGNHQIRIGHVSPIDGFCVWACVYNGNFKVFIHITITNHSFHQFY